MPSITVNRKKIFTLLVSSLVIFGTVALVWASGGGGGGHADSGAQMKDFMWRVIDFAALAALLIWALSKQNIKGALKSRQDAIETMLAEAAEARDAAERKLKEYTAKLEQANKEIDEISASIKLEAEQEKIRIIAEAGIQAAKIQEQARQAADQEVLKAKAELRHEAARLAVQLAEQKIKESITKNDQSNLVGEYLTKAVRIQ